MAALIKSNVQVPSSNRACTGIQYRNVPSRRRIRYSNPEFHWQMNKISIRRNGTFERVADESERPGTSVPSACRVCGLPKPCGLFRHRALNCMFRWERYCKFVAEKRNPFLRTQSTSAMSSKPSYTPRGRGVRGGGYRGKGRGRGSGGRGRGGGPPQSNHLSSGTLPNSSNETQPKNQREQPRPKLTHCS